MREIKTLARLNHPGIVTIYDLGRGEGESVYFVMELVEGGPFTSLGPLEPDPEPLRDLLEAAITVAETLHYVHRLGVVHRDVTPRNILLTAQLQPKVMDFGLVQLAETTRQLTRTGLTLGTPHYMAPEQALSGAVGAHTDLYAFGAVLYKAVTGVTPFDADNDQAVLYQHVYGDITPALDHNPFVPAALSDLISLLLSKHPHERPASGRSVAAALRTILATTLQAATQQRLGGPAQQGTYPYGPVNPKRLVCRWQLALGEGPQWPGALTAAEGFVFLGLRNETVRALRPADGTTEAEFQTDDEVNTAPLYHHGHLAVVSRDGALSLLSWPGGRTLWREAVGAVGVTPFGRDLVISSRDGNLQARSLDKGLLWRSEAASPLLTPPVLYRGTVYRRYPGRLGPTGSTQKRARASSRSSSARSPPHPPPKTDCCCCRNVPASCTLSTWTSWRCAGATASRASCGPRRCAGTATCTRCRGRTRCAACRCRPATTCGSRA